MNQGKIMKCLFNWVILAFIDGFDLSFGPYCTETPSEHLSLPASLSMPSDVIWLGNNQLKVFVNNQIS